MPLAPPDHLGEDEPGQPFRRDEVRLQDRFDPIEVGLFEVVVVLDARVVHEQVDGSELVLSPGHELLEVLALRHVGGDRDDPDAEIAHRLGRRLEILRGACR